MSISAANPPEQRIIVKYRASVIPDVLKVGGVDATIEAAGRAYGLAAKRLRTMGTGAEVVALDRHLDAATLRGYMSSLAADPRVEYVEEDRLLQAVATPNDTRYNEQWTYYEPTAGIKANTAWDSTSGAGVVVAVIDTGYRPHVDLAANILSGYDMISSVTVANDGNLRDSDARDPGDWTVAGECATGSAATNSSWHGTHVSGTIAALTNNALGVAGVAHGAKVLPVRVLGKCGGYTSDIADGIIWASGGSVSGVPSNATPAKVINLSLGGSGTCGSATQTAINLARSLGATVVVAAGNSNADASGFTPANCAGVVTVAAVNRSGGRAYYSNYGAMVDVAAPGGAQSYANDPNGILSTLNTGLTTPGSDSYVFHQGTSMAAPHVAGVAALLNATKPGITPEQIETALKSTTRAFPATCTGCGTGIVDAPAAMIYVAASSSSCPTGYVTYTGTFTAVGQSAYAPTSSGFRPTVNGTLAATLVGPTGTNFNLYLQRRKNTSTSWSQVAGSQSATSNEGITYTSGRTTYYYRWRATSYSGTGLYTLCTKYAMHQGPMKGS